MKTGNSSPSKYQTRVDINFNEEFDDDEIEEKNQKSKETEIKSYLRAPITSEEAANGSIDAKLKSILTGRSYDAIVQSTEERATDEYLQNVVPSIQFLIQNHQIIQQEFGTSNDHSTEWRIDTEEASQEQLYQEVAKLKKKLDKIRQENDFLEQEKESNQAKLDLINSQNQKLEELL